jgi:hypothetical protein
MVLLDLDALFLHRLLAFARGPLAQRQVLGDLALLGARR